MRPFTQILKIRVKHLIRKQLDFWRLPQLVSSTALGIIMLGASLTINYSAGLYTNSITNNPVQDIILDNIPVFRTGFIFVYGALAMWFFVMIILILNPRYLPFALKSIALLVTIRSIFTIMTHLGPYPNMTTWPQNNLLEKFSFGADFFFSGHTAFPFLISLILWHKKIFRWIFIVLSLFFATSVLSGHLHYSIDVFAAFFITYSVFILGCRLFTDEYEIMYGKKPKFTLGHD
jgi:hypothetical protein